MELTEPVKKSIFSLILLGIAILIWYFFETARDRVLGVLLFLCGGLYVKFKFKLNKGVKENG